VDSCERPKSLGLMVFSCLEGLMALFFSDFLSLEIDDISKGKYLAKMIRGKKT